MPDCETNEGVESSQATQCVRDCVVDYGGMDLASMSVLLGLRNEINKGLNPYAAGN